MCFNPFSDVLVGLLSLIFSGYFASANCPDGLVGDDDITPLVNFQLIRNGLKLSGANLVSLATFSFFKSFTDADHDSHTVLNGDIGLESDLFVC